MLSKRPSLITSMGDFNSLSGTPYTYIIPITVLIVHRGIVEECIRLLSEVTKCRVDEAWTMEQRAPMTHRDRHFLNYRTHYLEHYRLHYQSSRRGEGLFVKLANGTLEDTQAQLVATSLGNLIEAGAENINKMDLLKLAPHNDNEAALEIMAEVRAYYHSTSVPYISSATFLCEIMPYSRDAALY